VQVQLLNPGMADGLRTTAMPTVFATISVGK
jgi:hypothetical protein